MPEVASAPTAPTQSTSPSPQPDQSSASQPQAAPKGIDGLMADFDKSMQPKPAEAKAPAQKAPEESGKDKTVPEVAKPDAPKPNKPEDLWAKAPEKLKNEHFKLKRESEEKISKYEQRIKEIESKPRETAADNKLVEEYQNRIKELEQSVSQYDYRNSAEYKRDYVQRWEGEYKAAANEVKNLKVKEVDAEGNEKFRPATDQDFARLMRMAPGEQDEVAANMFGHYSSRVMARILELQRIERAAENAVQEHSKNIEVKTKEQELNRQREEGLYQKSFDSANAELQSKWPQFFAPDEADTEVSEALKSGYDFVDNVLKSAAAMKPDDRAAYNAVLRARAGAFPRVALENNRLKSKVSSLEEELAKFRKSDPGSAEGRNPVEGSKASASGIMDMASQFDK